MSAPQPPTVLVTRRVPASVRDLLARSCAVEMWTGQDPMPREVLLTEIGRADGLLCVVTDRIDREAIDAGQRLRVISNIAVGYDNIDSAYARAQGIVVTNTPDVLTDAVAEFTWGLILAVARRIAEGDRLVRAGRWHGWALDFMLGSELRGKRLGIVGAGRIGRAVAARAPAFGMDVRFAARGQARGGRGEHELPFEELLHTSDVVTLHVPMSDANRHLIDRRRLAGMKRSAYLVNTSRGPVVDEAALAWALEERLLAGAALDVYEAEPDVHASLLRLDNVVLAPHLGSATFETRAAMADLAARNAAAVLAGDGPLTPVPR